MSHISAWLLRTVARVFGSDHAVPMRSVHLEVVDTAVGMDEETRRCCLEPFFTTKGDRGTGLGLAMVYAMAQRHGAEVEIEGTPSKGTTMRLVFPVPAVMPEATRPAAVQSPPAPQPAPQRVLIVNDDALIFSAVKDASPGTAVILLTGRGQQLVAERDVPAEVDCVQQPPKVRELREAIAHSAATARAQEDAP